MVGLVVRVEVQADQACHHRVAKWTTEAEVSVVAPRVAMTEPEMVPRQYPHPQAMPPTHERAFVVMPMSLRMATWTLQASSHHFHFLYHCCCAARR